MRNALLCAALAVSPILSAHESFAAPGGRGGAAAGTRGGAARGGLSSGPAAAGARSIGGANNFGNLPAGRVPQNFQPTQNQNLKQQFNNLSGQAGKLQNVQPNVTNFQSKVTSGNQPFTASWYAGHPQAWQYTHPHADAAAVAGFAATAAWLGWTNVPVTPYASGYTTADGQVVANEEQNDAANDLAQTGAIDTASNDDWLPLGIYAVSTERQTDATHMLELFVSKDGILRGSYYDVVSDHGEKIQGAVDRESQRAAWRVGSGKVVFQTGLHELTQPNSAVSVHFENGQTRLWTLARLQDPPVAGK